MKETITLSNAKYMMARRRINIARCIIEDGSFNLLTSENLVEILSSALVDLDEAEVAGQAQGVTVERGLNWNAYPRVASCNE
jgi:hypothetical protein